MQRIKQIDLQEEPVSNIVAEEWNAFDNGNVANINRFSIVDITPIGSCKSMIDGISKGKDICVNCEISVPMRNQPSYAGCTSVKYIPSSLCRLPLYSR